MRDVKIGGPHQAEDDMSRNLVARAEKAELDAAVMRSEMQSSDVVMKKLEAERDDLETTAEEAANILAETRDECARLRAALREMIADVRRHVPDWHFGYLRRHDIDPDSLGGES